MRKFTSQYPVEFVVTELDTFVSVLVTFTFAPATTAPCGSMTFPVILPRDSCAKQLKVKVTSAAQIRMKCRISFRVALYQDQAGPPSSKLWAACVPQWETPGRLDSAVGC